MQNNIKWFWIATLVGAVIQVLYYYPGFPDQMASHFDMQGNPDDWSSKDQFLILWLVVLVTVNVWPPIVGLLMGKLPPKLINIPNRSYWMADDDRRRKAAAVTAAMCQGCCGGTNLLLIGACWTIYQANLSEGAAMSIWLLLPAPLIVMMASILWGMMKFRKPDERRS